MDLCLFTFQTNIDSVFCANVCELNGLALARAKTQQERRQHWKRVEVDDFPSTWIWVRRERRRNKSMKPIFSLCVCSQLICFSYVSYTWHSAQMYDFLPFNLTKALRKPFGRRIYMKYKPIWYTLTIYRNRSPIYPYIAVEFARIIPYHQRFNI